jgi:hypothetical protein
MTCGFGYDDAAYVLGALAPAERAAYEQHLAGCASCREAVAGIAVLPGLLRRLGEPQEAAEPAITTAPSRLPELVGIMHKVRRRRKVQSVAAALAAACVALVIGLAMGGLRMAPAQMMVMDKLNPDTAITAEVAMAPVSGGTEITMRCSYPDNGRGTRPYTFRLVAVGTDGSVEQIGSWMAKPGDDIKVTGTVRYGHDALTRLEVRARDGTALLALDLPVG